MRSVFRVYKHELDADSGTTPSDVQPPDAEELKRRQENIRGGLRHVWSNYEKHGQCPPPCPPSRPLRPLLAADGSVVPT